MVWIRQVWCSVWVRFANRQSRSIHLQEHFHKHSLDSNQQHQVAHAVCWYPLLVMGHLDRTQLPRTSFSYLFRHYWSALNDDETARDSSIQSWSSNRPHDHERHLPLLIHPARLTSRSTRTQVQAPGPVNFFHYLCIRGLLPEEVVLMAVLRAVEIAH
jgi:hypothetical protein